MTSIGLKMPPLQNAFQMALTCDLMGPVMDMRTRQGPRKDRQWRTAAARIQKTPQDAILYRQDDPSPSSKAPNGYTGADTSSDIRPAEALRGPIVSATVYME